MRMARPGLVVAGLVALLALAEAGGPTPKPSAGPKPAEKSKEVLEPEGQTILNGEGVSAKADKSADQQDSNPCSKRDGQGQCIHGKKCKWHVLQNTPNAPKGECIARAKCDWPNEEACRLNGGEDCKWAVPEAPNTRPLEVPQSSINQRTEYHCVSVKDKDANAKKAEAASNHRIAERYVKESEAALHPKDETPQVPAPVKKGDATESEHEKDKARSAGKAGDMKKESEAIARTGAQLKVDEAARRKAEQQKLAAVKENKQKLLRGKSGEAPDKVAICQAPLKHDLSDPKDKQNQQKGKLPEPDNKKKCEARGCHWEGKVCLQGKPVAKPDDDGEIEERAADSSNKKLNPPDTGKKKPASGA